MLRALLARVKDAGDDVEPLLQCPTPPVHVVARDRGTSTAALSVKGLHAHIVPWYIGTTMKTKKYRKRFVVERVQTGVRIEKRLLKVLKALAEFHDLTLGDLLEGIVLHAFDGKEAFQKPSRQRIKQLKKFYGFDLDFRASHRLIEARAATPKPKTKRSLHTGRAKQIRSGRKAQGAK
jgi:hypothetical protein